MCFVLYEGIVTSGDKGDWTIDFVSIQVNVDRVNIPCGFFNGLHLDQGPGSG